MNPSHRSADSGLGCPSDASPDVVRQYVSKIANSPGFKKSERLKRFLSYAVERVLTGETGDLKEYALAIEVFDRNPSYDPKVDAVVRVEARRLRQRLEQYYALEGARDPIRIQFPVGTYVPLITVTESLPAVDPPTGPRILLLRRPWWLLVAAAGIVILAIAIANNFPLTQKRPEVTRLAKDASAAFEPAVSRDGKTLAYASDQAGNVDIWVRPLAGGNARRITSNEAIDRSPDFSPDATLVAFRSERDSGGVYLVPTAGGPDHLIAPFGQSPKFSPDGKWIAYWTGQEHHFEGKVFIVPSAGGKAVRIGADLADARWPLWSENGKSLLVFGSRIPPHNSGAASGPTDLFLVPVRGGTGTETGWTAALRRARIWAEGSATPGSVAWNGQVLQFSASTAALNEFSGITQEVANLWQIRLPERSGLVEGEPRRLTYGAASEHDSVLLPDGSTIYCSSRYTLTPVLVPLGEGGLPQAQFQDLFSGAGGYVLPRLSRDGSTAVALSDRSGQIDIWLKDLPSGLERPITATSIAEHVPVISSDGGTIYYGIRDGSLYPMYRIRAKGGNPERVCEDCGTPSDVSPKGEYVLYHAGDPWSAYSLNLTTGEKNLIAGHSRRVYSSRFSPDGRWIAFLTDTGNDASPRRIFIAPFVAGRNTPEANWIPVTDGLHPDFDPAWSPDGATVFFISDRDGNRCIWAVRLDFSKHAFGEPFPVIHLHRMARHIPGSVGASIFGISPGRGGLVFGAMELNSAIYRLENTR